IKAVLLVAVFALVGYALAQQWKKIDWQTVTIRPWPLVFAFVALVGVSTVQMISYRTLLAAYATAPTWRQMLAVAWVPPLGKYVPGKVAALMAAMSMLRRFGIPAAVAVSVVLVLDGLAVVAGLITGAPLLLWEPIRRIAPWAWAVCVPVTVAGIVCLWPAVFGRLINFLLRKLKKPPLPRMPPLADYAIPVACAFAQWLLAGLALLWIVQSVTGEARWGQLPILISFAALSQTLGYLALFAPGGIGPREAILLAGLIPLVGPLAAVIVPIRAVMQIAVDVLLALVGLRLLRENAPFGGG
ncbi:MAG TPA: lysylphosphatidylglycerol synthase domain-containing protein, partial [Tepidisphaeraceae bacterium]